MEVVRHIIAGSYFKENSEVLLDFSLKDTSEQNNIFAVNEAVLSCFRDITKLMYITKNSYISQKTGLKDNRKFVETQFSPFG